MPALQELGASLSSSTYAGAQRLTFRCPTCRQRVIAVDIWNGKPSVLEYEPGKAVKLWHAEQGPHQDWGTLTISPSIDDKHGKTSDSGCEGWHGHVVNGVAA